MTRWTRRRTDCPLAEFEVKSPIPAVDAMPGDRIIFRPVDPKFPIVLIRSLTSDELALALRDPNATTLISASSGISELLPSGARFPQEPERLHLLA